MPEQVQSEAFSRCILTHRRRLGSVSYVTLRVGSAVVRRWNSSLIYDDRKYFKMSVLDAPQEQPLKKTLRLQQETQAYLENKNSTYYLSVLPNLSVGHRPLFPGE